MSLPGGYEQILIPDTDRWEVTMCHFASDSPNYKEANYCLTWKDGQRVLYRIYSKRLKSTKSIGNTKRNIANNTGKDAHHNHGSYKSHWSIE